MACPELYHSDIRPRLAKSIRHIAHRRERIDLSHSPRRRNYSDDARNRLPCGGGTWRSPASERERFEPSSSNWDTLLEIRSKPNVNLDGLSVGEPSGGRARENLGTIVVLTKRC